MVEFELFKDFVRKPELDRPELRLPSSRGLMVKKFTDLPEQLGFTNGETDIQMTPDNAIRNGLLTEFEANYERRKKRTDSGHWIKQENSLW